MAPEEKVHLWKKVKFQENADKDHAYIISFSLTDITLFQRQIL